MILKEDVTKKKKVSLKALRTDAGLSLEKAAKKLGVSKYTLYNYEHFKSQPTIDVLEKILELYNVGYDAIRFTNDKEDNPQT